MPECWECGRDDPRARGCCDLNTPGYKVCDACYLGGRSEHRYGNHTKLWERIRARKAREAREARQAR